MCVSLRSVGFVGLGIMGLPMARHLCDAGYQDVGFMVKESSTRGCPLPITQAVQSLLAKALAQGLGSQDVAAVIGTIQNKPA